METNTCLPSFSLPFRRAFSICCLPVCLNVCLPFKCVKLLTCLSQRPNKTDRCLLLHFRVIRSAGILVSTKLKKFLERLHFSFNILKGASVTNSQQALSFNMVAHQHKSIPHKASFLPLTGSEVPFLTLGPSPLLLPLSPPISHPPLLPSSSINLSPLLSSSSPLLHSSFPSSAPPVSPHSPPPPPRASWSVWS